MYYRNSKVTKFQLSTGPPNSNLISQTLNVLRNEESTINYVCLAVTAYFQAQNKNQTYGAGRVATRHEVLRLSYRSFRLRKVLIVFYSMRFDACQDTSVVYNILQKCRLHVVLRLLHKAAIGADIVLQDRQTLCVAEIIPANL